MKITWHGHSCFCLESNGYSVAVDPYSMESYPPLHVKANEVCCSHGHYDHNCTQAVDLLEEKQAVFAVEEMETFHDDQKGALRGKSIMRAFCAEGLRIVHCGDIGHMPDEAQSAFMRGCDVLMIPVGGYYTIDAVDAKRIVDAVQPRTILPMHYRHGSHGMDVLSEVTAFTDLFPSEQVTVLQENSILVEKDRPTGVVVFQFE